MPPAILKKYKLISGTLALSLDELYLSITKSKNVNILIDAKYQNTTGIIGIKLLRRKLETTKSNIKTMRNPLQHIVNLFFITV